MKRVLFYLLIFYCCQLASFGQNSPKDTLFAINATPYSSEQFLSFSSNKQLNNKLSTKEILDQYILLQLKVIEAKKNHIGEQMEVQHAIENFTTIAINSFLYPSTISEDKISEAFERIQHYIKARHILIKVNRHASSKDSLSAYTKAKEIRALLLKGKRFKKIALKYSDDQHVSLNYGEIGYFTAFDMDYSFESAAYRLKIGEYSQPIKTQYGYHIIQVVDKIRNPGKIKIRPIPLETHGGIKPKKQQLDSIYALFKKENQFKKLPNKYSLDKSLAKIKEQLPWISLFDISPEIEKVAFQLKEINELSEPIKTEFGYQILQLVDRKEYNSLSDCREEISQLFSRDPRSKPNASQILSQIKKEYQFTENRKLLSNFYSILDYAYADLEEPLFTIGQIAYKQEDFAAYLSQQPSKNIYENFIEYIKRIYESFTNNSILAFYKKQVLEHNSDLKNKIQNYKDELLAYKITKQKTCFTATNKALNLLTFYEDNKNKYDRDIDYEAIKLKVAADYRKHLISNWEQKLRSEYKIEISQATLSKIAQ